MSNAFDSAPVDYLIFRCWQWLGLGGGDIRGRDALMPHAFSPAHGTGQVDIHSFLRACCIWRSSLPSERDPDSADHVSLPKTDGSLYSARVVCYADDLQSQAAQDTASFLLLWPFCPSVL